MLYPPELRARPLPRLYPGQESLVREPCDIAIQFLPPLFLFRRLELFKKTRFSVRLDQFLQFEREGAFRGGQLLPQLASPIVVHPEKARIRRERHGCWLASQLGGGVRCLGRLRVDQRLDSRCASGSRSCARLLQIQLRLPPPERLLETKSKRLHGISCASAPICRMVSSNVDVSAEP